MIKKQHYEGPATLCLSLDADHVLCGSESGSTITDMSVGDEINLNDNFKF